MIKWYVVKAKKSFNLVCSNNKNNVSFLDFLYIRLETEQTSLFIVARTSCHTKQPASDSASFLLTAPSPSTNVVRSLFANSLVKVYVPLNSSLMRKVVLACKTFSKIGYLQSRNISVDICKLCVRKFFYFAVYQD